MSRKAQLSTKDWPKTTQKNSAANGHSKGGVDLDPCRKKSCLFISIVENVLKQNNSRKLSSIAIVKFCYEKDPYFQTKFAFGLINRISICHTDMDLLS